MKRALLLLAFACSHSQTNQLPAEAWGVADYASEGLRIDAPWSADDYMTAVTTLQRIAVDHRERLPRFHGPKSGAVFAKLVTAPPDDPSAPIDKRFVAHATSSEALKDLLKLYLPNGYDAAPREAIEVSGAELHEAAMLAGLSDAFIASFGSDDPSRATRLGGIDKMRGGDGLMLLGLIFLASDTRIADADRVAALEHAAAELPVLFPFTHPDTQQQIRDLLAKQASKLPEGALRAAAITAQHALPN
jgi:hypothetical protein